MAIRYLGNNFNFKVNSSRLLDGAPSTESTPKLGSSVLFGGLANTSSGRFEFEHVLRPEFNYIAKRYNDAFSGKDERLLPTPYSEVFQECDEIEEVYSTPGFNMLKGGIIDSGNENSNTNPRLIFTGYGNQGGSVIPYEISERNTEYTDEFSNIVLANGGMINRAHSTVRVGNQSKYFPQYVEISLGGPGLSRRFAKNNTSVNSLQYRLQNAFGYYHLISDFVNDMPDPTNFTFGEQTLEGWKLWGGDNPDDSLTQRAVNTDEGLFYTHIAPITDSIFDSNKSLYYLNLRQKISNLGTFNHPNLSGDEYLFFEIQKYKVGGGRGSNGKKQSFWIGNFGNNSVKVFDTQVHVGSGNRYRYEFYAYVMAGRIQDGVPEYWLLKVPIFEQTCKIEQPSLPVPQVSFSNVKDSKNKIKINLNLSANSENPPEFFGLFESEKADFDQRESEYDITREKDKFTYESQAGDFEIYKMETQPQQGPDGNPYQNIATNSTVTRIQAPFGGTLATLTDSIVPFKKYYYVFRAINAYGYPSNPSPIWQIEKTRDADETFLHANVVGFAKPNQDKYKLDKTMSRLLQIVPSLNQSSFDSAQLNGGTFAQYSDSDPIPTLGVVGEKMWYTKLNGVETNQGIRFKVRLTSRDTGRKLDLNLKFILNKNHNN